MIAFFMASCFKSSAAVIVVDSFEEKALALSELGLNVDRAIVPGGFLGSRTVNVSGTGAYGAVLDPAAGTIRFYATTRGVPVANEVTMRMTYGREDNSLFSLLGSDAFVIKVSSLQGVGRVLAVIDNRAAMPVPFMVAASGEVRIPFAALGDRFNLNAVRRISFQFDALAADFSMTLDEISIVPEVSSAWLAGLGSAAWFLRRRRALTHIS